MTLRRTLGQSDIMDYRAAYFAAKNNKEFVYLLPSERCLGSGGVIINTATTTLKKKRKSHNRTFIKTRINDMCYFGFINLVVTLCCE